MESPIPCRSAGSSTDGVFFSSGRIKLMDNRRLISKSQMKGAFFRSEFYLTLFITFSQIIFSINGFFFFNISIPEFREAFRLFDKDGDGSITKEELGSVMRSLGQFARVEELREMLLEIDVDGNKNFEYFFLRF